MLHVMLHSDLAGRLDACEEAWKSGNPLALAEAIALVKLHEQPIPDWLESALVTYVIRRRTRKERKRYRLSSIHLLRYIAVRKFRAIGRREWWHRREDDHKDALTWKQAREHASKTFVGGIAAGTPRTMRKSFELVHKAVNSRRIGRFFIYRGAR
jgi:hypothetical protein